MPLTVIDRYVLREILQTWGAVTAVLLLILLTNTLAYMLGRVVEGDIAGAALVPLFLTNVTGYVVTVIPLGLYLGLLIAFGRMYAESEMSALGACGVGFARLYRPVMIAGVLGALLTGLLGNFVSPWAKRVEHDVKERIAARSEVAGVAAGRFNRAADGRVVLFAERRDEASGHLREVFVEARDPGGGSHIVRAEVALEQTDPETGWRYLEFRNGYRYTGSPGSSEFRIVEFERHGVRIPEQQVDVGRVDRDGMSTASLAARDDPKSAAEVQWRLAMPFACLMLALAALPISHTSPRKGRYGKIAIGLVLYLAYANALVVARDALAEGHVPMVLGMWWIHGVALVLVLALIAHRAGWRWSAHVLGALLGRRR
jgi:lipopolysaccharide export system permease protein